MNTTETTIKCYCPICKTEGKFIPFGNPKRKNAICPTCKSLERHRFLYILYNFLFLNKSSSQKVLHFAPEEMLYNEISKNKNIEYIVGDLYPELFKFAPNCMKIDAMNLPFEKKSFDIILCNHILEHIEDDRLFIKNITEILKDKGKFIFTIPVKYSFEKTYEDKNIKTEEDRLKHFGQKDHVRIYGNDILDRFEGEFTINKISTDFLGEHIKENLSLSNETIYILEKN